MEGIVDAPVHDGELRSKYDSIAVVGPTACGKTRRAVQLAHAFNGEIISADSRQVYRRMDIGTGKDLEEYGDVPYHLIDICEPGYKYNLHQYLRDFRKVYDHLLSRKTVPIICGGSGMYVENAIAGIRLPDVPENRELRNELKSKTLDELTQILSVYKRLHNITDVDTVARAVRAIEIQDYYVKHPEEAKDADVRTSRPLDCLVVGVSIDVESRRERISRRLRDRVIQGLIPEVKSLIDSGVTPENLMYYGLEYKFVTQHVIGELSQGEMLRLLEIAIHQFAKRQMTWFRGMERRGFNINWLPYDMPEAEFVVAVRDLYYK